MKKEFDIAELITKFMTGELSDDQKKTLNQWVQENESNKKLLDDKLDLGKQLEKLKLYESFDKDRNWNALSEVVTTTRSISPSAVSWYRYAAAIFIPIVALASIYYLLNRPAGSETISHVDDFIQPGTQKATLILADGSNIDLEGDNVPDKLIQQDTEIINSDQQLSYTAADKAENQPLIYNELITPRGGTYDLILADGTKVWLNADSKLKYPVAFTDSTRQVYLEGEALLQVAHNGKPFIVSSSGQDVRVLGTVFNISAYKDEAYIKTTLVEGSVMVTVNHGRSDRGKEIILKPNEQSSLSLTEDDLLVEEVKVSHFTSWVDGKFEFEKDNLDEVMKQLSRWYDFDYRFENPKAKSYHFSGRINNSESISDILEMLELTTDVAFGMDDGSIIIL